jgi:hypothetical protein
MTSREAQSLSLQKSAQFFAFLGSMAASFCSLDSRTSLESTEESNFGQRGQPLDMQGKRVQRHPKSRESGFSPANATPDAAARPKDAGI